MKGMLRRQFCIDINTHEMNLTGNEKLCKIHLKKLFKKCFSFY